MLVVSYNPGYQNLLKGMKPSTRQRFVAMRFGYPAVADEERIVAREAGSIWPLRPRWCDWAGAAPARSA